MSAPVRTVVDFADLAELPGTVLGTSAWRTVEQEAISAFGALTGDEQWIHVDPARAADGPFGGTIAHGFYTLSLSTAVIAEVAEFTGVGAVVNHGCEKVRFTRPVPSGSRIRGRVSVASTRRRGRQFTEVVFEVVFELEGADAPACSANIVTLLSPVEAIA